MRMLRLAYIERNYEKKQQTTQAHCRRSCCFNEPDDTSGNPSESYHWGHLAAVRREWLHEFWHPQVDAFPMTLAEIRTIESQVRRELYP
jgi:hypothetical protein